jgi:hypothetical protein
MAACAESSGSMSAGEEVTERRVAGPVDDHCLGAAASCLQRYVTVALKRIFHRGHRDQEVILQRPHGVLLRLELERYPNIPVDDSGSARAAHSGSPIERGAATSAIEEVHQRTAARRILCGRSPATDERRRDCKILRRPGRAHRRGTPDDDAFQRAVPADDHSASAPWPPRNSAG